MQARQRAAIKETFSGRKLKKRGVGRSVRTKWNRVSDMGFDGLFTEDKPVIFAFHAYPWLIHWLTYRHTNHGNIHVRGYKEEGTITTPFDMTVLNDLDRFHLVMDAINRLPQTGDKRVYLKQQLKDKLLEHKQHINKHGQDLPDVRNWQWGATNAAKQE
jgi:xylulose-5-phosphate/fructose-6-phosphate phosphoketolase